jgi:hypothetical protein
MNNFATANNQTATRSVGRVVPAQARRGVTSQETAMHRRLGRALHGGARYWTATQAWLGMTGFGNSRNGNAGPTRRCVARQGADSQRRLGAAWLGAAGRGGATQAWHGLAGPRLARQRRHGQARQAKAWRGQATQAWLGAAPRGRAGLGKALHDTNRGARPGYKLRSTFQHININEKQHH